MMQPAGDAGGAVPARAKAPARSSAVSHRAFLALTYVLLAVSLGFVLTAVTPSIERALGWSEVRTVSRSSPRTTSANRAGLDAVAEKERSLAEEIDGAADPEIAARSAVIRAKTVVYETPGKSPLSSLPPGAVLRVLGERGDFLHVLYEDRGDAGIGWVKKSDVLVR